MIHMRVVFELQRGVFYRFISSLLWKKKVVMRKQPYEEVAPWLHAATVTGQQARYFSVFQNWSFFSFFFEGLSVGRNFAWQARRFVTS